MKKINIYRLAAAAFTFIMILSFITYGKATQSRIADSVLRLHIIAASDSDSDQKIKLLVRDRILKDAAFLFKNSKGATESLKIAKENIDFLTETANDELMRQGSSDRARIEIGEFPFPVKVYDNIMLPSGRYCAVRIIIGEGNGHNWWCVMYPPMCTIDGVTMDSGGKKKLKKSLSDSDYKIVSQKAEVRFKIVDIINSIF